MRLKSFLVWAVIPMVSALSYPGRACFADPPKPASAHPEIKLPDEGSLAIVVVRSETWEKDRQLKAKIKKLKAAKDFDQLDLLADALRKSKDAYPTGIPFLSTYYDYLNSLDADDAESIWLAHIDMLKDWIKKKPDSPTAREALADAYISYAWKARGSGWANTVTQEAYKLFEERLHLCEKVIKDAEKLKVRCPMLYATKSTLSMALDYSKAEARKIFDEGVKLDSSNMQLYANHMMSLLPRWGGEPGEFEQFVKSEADKIDGKSGDEFYARMVWRYNRDNWDGDEMFKNTKLSYARAKKGLNFLIKDAQDPLPYQSELAQLAVIANDMPTAQTMFKTIGNRCDIWMWTQVPSYVARRDAAAGKDTDASEAPDQS